MDKNIKKRKLLRAFGVAVIAVAVLGVLLRTLSLFLFYDSDIGYYARGAALPTVFNALMIASAIACTVLCFIPKISLEPDSFGESRTASMMYTIPCLMSIYALIARMSLIEQYSNLGLAVPKVQIITLALCAVAVIFFAVSIFGAKANPTVLVITGAVAMLWLMLMLIDLYFDMYVQINSPNKTMMAFALVSAVLFLSSEIRLPIEEKKYNTRLFTASVAMLMLPVSSIPTIIAHFGGAFGDSYSVTLGDTVCLALFFPACVRFVKICFSTDKVIKNDSCEVQEESDPE